jgi:hypothetical protein
MMQKNHRKLVVDGMFLQRVLTKDLLEVTLRESMENPPLIYLQLNLPTMSMLIAQLLSLRCEICLIFCKIKNNGSIIILLATEEP